MLQILKDKSLGDTKFMEILREGQQILEHDVANGPTSTMKSVVDSMRKFSTAGEEMAQVGDLNESQQIRLDLMMACFKGVLASFLLKHNEADLFQKLYENTSEGKLAVSLVKDVFTDPDKARNYMLHNGWAKEKVQ